MKKPKYLACLAVLASPLPVAAASYTYTVDYNFPILREGNQLGAEGIGDKPQHGSVRTGDAAPTQQRAMAPNSGIMHTSGR